MIYLDNAASSHPKPHAVVRAVAEQLKRNGANAGRGGHPLSLAASRVLFSARQALAEEFETQAELVLFTANATEAINLALKGLIAPGDHVLISDLEHNSVLRPLVTLRAAGAEFTVVPTEKTDEKTAANFRERIRPNTKMIFCTHASNVTGRILPTATLGRLCRERGLLFGVDAAQTAGTEAISLPKDNIDLLCLPGHKGLLGPQGTGALLLARPLPLRTLTEGGTGTRSLEASPPPEFPEGYECGTRNTPGIAGLRAGLEYATQHRERIRTHEEELRRCFTEEMRRIDGFRILGEGERFVATVALDHVSLPSETLAEALSDAGICTRGGFHCSLAAHTALGTLDRGALRISFGHANRVSDVYECVKCLKKYQTN